MTDITELKRKHILYTLYVTITQAHASLTNPPLVKLFDDGIGVISNDERFRAMYVISEHADSIEVEEIDNIKNESLERLIYASTSLSPFLYNHKKFFAIL
ncbi:hypothetical protein PHABIO_47 [Pseudomonas phage Phabio]|uniref:Uncharacterized protein n=1 Tax=Pseudomonas phage Phabio TaxID=2006668 RepID=A0A1Y0SZM0_9CAUD|nr:hypothetical protein MZD05_gp047 [Pseudomonas phage Phabio]ARV76678.1 hypothetical protein PHABIO_47 [Pseudomonas phage Phabio]